MLQCSSHTPLHVKVTRITRSCRGQPPQRHLPIRLALCCVLLSHAGRVILHFQAARRGTSKQGPGDTDTAGPSRPCQPAWTGTGPELVRLPNLDRVFAVCPSSESAHLVSSRLHHLQLLAWVTQGLSVPRQAGDSQ